MEQGYLRNAEVDIYEIICLSGPFLDKFSEYKFDFYSGTWEGSAFQNGSV